MRSFLEKIRGMNFTVKLVKYFSLRQTKSESVCIYCSLKSLSVRTLCLYCVYCDFGPVSTLLRLIFLNAVILAHFQLWNEASEYQAKVLFIEIIFVPKITNGARGKLDQNL